MDQNNIKAFIDGSSLGNPGEAGFGVVLKTMNDDVLETYGNYIGRATNNVAEYNGLLGCLNLLSKYKPVKITIYSDSELLVEQINGHYRVKQPHLQTLFNKAINLIRAATFQISIEHIPREKNKLADKLARQAVRLRTEVKDMYIHPQG